MFAYSKGRPKYDNKPAQMVANSWEEFASGVLGNISENKAKASFICGRHAMTDTERFLHTLDPQATTWTFQTFSDSDSKTKGLTKLLQGSLLEHRDNLADLNNRGAGVYVVINETDGKGRKAYNIQRVRACFADFDEPDPATLDRLRADSVPPSIIVESSPDKYHAYWIVDDLDLDSFKPLQKRISSVWGSDPAVSDLPRVMRLPGFEHRKGVPFETRLIDHNGRVYTAYELQNRYPEPAHAIDKKRNTSETYQEHHHSPRLPAGGMTPYATAALQDACNAVAGAANGTRNDTLNREAYGISRLVAGGEIPGALARESLHSAALHAGLAEGEIKSTLKSAFTAGSESPRTAPQHPRARDARAFAEILADAERLTIDSAADDISAVTLETAALNPVERRQVHDTIKAQTKIPLSVLREMLSNGTADGPDHLALARSAIAQIGEQDIISTQPFVWRWHGTGVWKKAEERAVRSWVQSSLDGTEEVTKGLVDSVTDLLKTEIFKAEHEFDIGPANCVNALNGEITLEAGQWTLRPHNREHYRTTQIPVRYDPAAAAPRFTQFLHEVFPGPDGEQSITAVLEMMGYSLMAHCHHERFIILVGNGANGKSVLLRLLEALAGYENVSGVQPSQFANKFQRAHLHGKLVNIVTEIEQGEVIDDAALKGIVSGEPSTVEHKFKDPFQMRPFATCWFGTNHMPHTRDFSDALFRRALILKFDSTFKPELGNCDPLLSEKLEAELPGVLNMALNAYLNAIQHGFTMPDSSKQARDEWRLEADQAAQFIEDVCTVDPASEVAGQALYDEYTFWARDNGITRTLTMKSFRDRMTRLGFGTRRSSSTRYVTGLRVTNSTIRQVF